MNAKLVAQIQRNLTLEQDFQTLSKENEEFLLEKSTLAKNLIKFTEHNRILSKELNEERLKNLEEVKKMTEIHNEKQLEINKLQNQLEIQAKTLEILRFEVEKSKELDFEAEMLRKSRLLEESDKKLASLQEKLVKLQAFAPKSNRIPADEQQLLDEISAKDEKITELEGLLSETAKKTDQFARDYEILLVKIRFSFIFINFPPKIPKKTLKNAKKRQKNAKNLRKPH